MSWARDNWLPLTVVGGVLGVSWYAGKSADEKRINGMTLDEWLDEIDRIKATKEPFYYSNNILGTPKYGNGIDSFWEQGWSPQGILSVWRMYEGEPAQAYFEKMKAWKKMRSDSFATEDGAGLMRNWTFLWQGYQNGGNSVIATSLEDAKRKVITEWGDPTDLTRKLKPNLSTLSDDPAVNKRRSDDWDSMWRSESFATEGWKGKCQRCGEKGNTSTMSWFNTDLICMDCSDKEKSHPKYQEAKDREHAEVKKGNLNYGGVGFEATKKKTKPRNTNRIKTMIELNPDMPITSHNHPDNPMVGHIEQKCSSDVCDETVLTHDRRIGKRCLKCYYQNWEDLYDMGATDTPPPVDMSIPYDVRYKRNTPAEIAEQEKRSIALQKQLNANRSKRYEKIYQDGLKTPLWSKNPKNILGLSWDDIQNETGWDKQYAQILKDKKKMSDKVWRKKYGIKSVGSKNDPDFDSEKADRNKDGKISEWEQSVGNAVAKGIREHSKKQSKSESFNADDGIQVAEGYNEWWDELDNIRSQYRPDNFFNRRLGNPKWEDGILQQMFKDGWTPKQALSSWKRYNGAVGHFKRRPLTQASTKICKNCGGQGHNSRSCTNERVRDIKYANDKSTRLKLSRKINALSKLGEGEQNTMRYINYGLGALAAGRGWDSPKMDFPIQFEHHENPYVDNSGNWKLVEKHWRDIQDMRDDLGVDDFKEMIDTTNWEVGQPNWNTYMSESYDAETFAAYVSKADTQRVRQLLKQGFPNLKFSVIKDSGRMSVRIMAGDIDFSDLNDDIPRTKRHWERWGNPKPVFKGIEDINNYHLDGYNPKYTSLFEKIISIMKGEAWFDNSDAQTDYFSTAYYISLGIGKWNKPYEYKPNLKKGTKPTMDSLIYQEGYGDDALKGLKGAYDAETFEARDYEPNKPYYATAHSDRPTSVMHPIKCGHYKMVMDGTGVWMSPTFYDTIEEMVEDQLWELADAILESGDEQMIQEYNTLKTVGEARKWLSKTTGTKLNFAPCFKKEHDYDSKALNALPITPIPYDSFDAESFNAVAIAPEIPKTAVDKALMQDYLMNKVAKEQLKVAMTYELALRNGGYRPNK